MLRRGPQSRKTPLVELWCWGCRRMRPKAGFKRVSRIFKGKFRVECETCAPKTLDRRKRMGGSKGIARE